MIVYAFLLWSLNFAAQTKDAKEDCFCKQTHYVYTKVGGVVVDSISIHQKLNNLKMQKNSVERSREIEKLFYLMENYKCPTKK